MALKLYLFVAFISVAFSQPSWKRVQTANQYIGRGETSFARCGAEKLCLIGGRGANRVSVLDTKALVWSPGKTGPFQMHHFQAVYGPDDCVWIAGAWTGSFPAEDAVNNIWAYCLAANKWEKRTSIPRPRGAGGAVFYQGKLYLVSGNVGGHRLGARVVPWFDCYDPVTGEWTELPDVPNPRDHFHVVVVGSKLYVAGGRFSTVNVPELFSNVAEEVDVYDFKTGVWSSLPDLPRPRGGVAATKYESTVMLLGGESERASAWTEVDILRNDKFVSFDDMPDPRHGTGAISCNGAVWIAGGVRVQGGGDASVETYAFFDGDTPPVCKNSTTINTPLPTSGTSTGKLEASSDEPSPPISPSSSDDDLSEDNTSASENSDTSQGENDGFFSDNHDNPSSDENDVNFSDETDDTPSNINGDNGGPSASVTPGPSEQNESEPNSERVCFPSDATVQLEDGSIKKMDELRIGDRVKVAHPNVYSEVYFFSHRHPNIASKSVVIETSVAGASLTLSPGHLVYSGGSLVPAAAINVGDTISISHEGYSQAKVTRISGKVTKGLYNPHTFHGDVIVNRVVASTYTSTMRPFIARVMLLPFKAAYRGFGARDRTESLNLLVLRALDIVFWR